jgi:hypothetical protein
MRFSASRKSFLLSSVIVMLTQALTTERTAAAKPGKV